MDQTGRCFASSSSLRTIDLRARPSWVQAMARGLEVSDHGLPATIVAGDRAGPGHVPDDIVSKQLLEWTAISARVHFALSREEVSYNRLGL
jgi:hypothetical protein